MSALIASFTTSESSGSRGITAVEPIGTTVGDTLVVFVFSDNSTTFSTNTSGWTLQSTTENVNGQGGCAVFGTNSVAGDLEVISSDFQDLNCIYHRITGADYPNIVWGDTVQGNSSSLAIPSITIPEDDCLELLLAGNDATITQTQPTGFTEVVTAPQTNNTLISYEGLSNSGPTGIREVSLSGSRRNAGSSVAIPASPPSGGGAVSISVGGSTAHIGSTTTALTSDNVSSKAITGSFVNLGQVPLASSIASASATTESGSSSVVGSTPLASSTLNVSSITTTIVLSNKGSTPTAITSFGIEAIPESNLATHLGSYPVVGVSASAFPISGLVVNLGQVPESSTASNRESLSTSGVISNAGSLPLASATLNTSSISKVGNFNTSGYVGVAFVTSTAVSIVSSGINSHIGNVGIASSGYIPVDRVIHLTGDRRDDIKVMGGVRLLVGVDGQRRPLFKISSKG